MRDKGWKVGMRPRREYWFGKKIRKISAHGFEVWIELSPIVSSLSVSVKPLMEKIVPPLVRYHHCTARWQTAVRYAPRASVATKRGTVHAHLRCWEKEENRAKNKNKPRNKRVNKTVPEIIWCVAFEFSFWTTSIILRSQWHQKKNSCYCHRLIGTFIR